jgi:hypothetical protein
MAGNMVQMDGRVGSWHGDRQKIIREQGPENFTGVTTVGCFQEAAW